MIAGLQKMTLLDYPGKVACTVFLQGCNYRCPFCHNSDLLPRQGEPLMDVDAFAAFLRKRRGLLDAVCVSGGEPTLQPELPGLLRRIRELGYAIKLDTNGSRPEVLRSLVEQGLVDYVAMDVKNSPALYPQTLGVGRPEMDKIEESLRFLLAENVDYELRTTLVRELHSAESILDMGQWLVSLVPGAKPKRLFLQKFTDRDSVVFSGLNPPLPEETAHFAELLAPFCGQVSIRGE